MKISVVTREYPPVTRYTGGIGVHYAALTRELARRGHDVHVVTLDEGGPPVAELEGVRLHRLLPRVPQRFWFLEDLACTFAAARALASVGPADVVFAAEWGGDACQYSRRKRIGPLVTNLATSLEQVLRVAPRRVTRGSRVRYAIQRRLERGQAERSDGIAACSSAVLEWARELWDIDHVESEVLPNFINVEQTRKLARNEPPDGFPGSGPVVLYFGRLEQRKGVHVLARAMPSVWQRVPDAQLVLIGGDSEFLGGRMSDFVRQQTAEHADSVHLLGHQPPERVLPAVAAADVVAQPSIWENFSIAALEARALGRAMVVTDGAGFTDFVRPGIDAVSVPANDVPALADALVTLLNERETRKRLGDAAAEASRAYDTSVAVDRYVRFFERVSAEGRLDDRA